MRLVRDTHSKSGWSALVVLRDVRVRGPLTHGRYVLASRKFRGRHPVDFGGHRKKPSISITIDWTPNQLEWQQRRNRKRLERARSMSPILK